MFFVFLARELLLRIASVIGLHNIYLTPLTRPLRNIISKSASIPLYPRPGKGRSSLQYVALSYTPLDLINVNQ